jgi:hypothetical protein
MLVYQRGSWFITGQTGGSNDFWEYVLLHICRFFFVGWGDQPMKNPTSSGVPTTRRKAAYPGVMIQTYPKIHGKPMVFVWKMICKWWGFHIFVYV